MQGACTLNLQPQKTRQHINLLDWWPNTHLDNISSENTNTYFILPSKKQTSAPLTSWDAQKHGELRSQPSATGDIYRDKSGQQAHGFMVSQWLIPTKAVHSQFHRQRLFSFTQKTPGSLLVLRRMPSACQTEVITRLQAFWQDTAQETVLIIAHGNHQCFSW